MKALLSDKSWAERQPSVPWAIGLVTFGTLALELALIRWTSSQVRIFAYFNNVVLITAFLGIGLGVALGRNRPGLVHLVVPGLLVLAVPLAFAVPLQLMGMKFPDQSIMLWGGQEVPANGLLFVRNIAIFIGLLGLIVGIFVCCGAALGVLFSRLPALRAYQADLFGSLLGVLAFTAASWLNAGPAVWLALGCAPFLWLSRRALGALAGLAVVGLGAYSVDGALFSPYNRIELVTDTSGRIELRVNRDFHQYMTDLSDRKVTIMQLDRDPEVRQLYADLRRLYDLPFRLNPQRGSALVVGAGTGNDVQAALRNGYAKVTSVDIDARIIQLGRELHPEAPYANPAVEPVVDDARAYFEKNRGQKFDVVCFGLLDSHAMSSAMSTLRLDNYVYTEQGIRAAWERVAPGGHLSLSFSCYGGLWQFERLYWTIADATGSEPVSFFSELHGKTVTFVVPRGAAPWLTAAAARETVIRPERTRLGTLTTTDDWPFLYLRPNTIPWGYFAVLASILVFATWSVRRAYGFGQGGAAFDWPLFLMGAAFLLIETRGVTSLSLLFGSTWVVNSAVFGGILTMVLLANAWVRRRQWQDPRPWFGLLLAMVLLQYAFPLAWLQPLPLLERAVAGGLLVGLPIGVAGIIVPMLLARSRDPATALGANLLGSVLGGCLEYFSMFIGLSATVLLALVLYLLAYLALARKAVAERAGASP